MIVPTMILKVLRGDFPSHVGVPEGRMAVALLEVALSSIKAFSTARPPLKLRPNHAPFYGQIMRILLGISWDIIDIMGINGVYFNGTIWYHINSFFSQPLLVTAQNEQNKHVSCSGQSQFVITAKHRGPTVFLLLGSKTHPWKVSIRGRSLRNNTMLQRDFKRSCKVVHPPKVYEATSFYPLAGENLPCNTDLRWEEPATPEHCSSFLCLFGVLDAVLIRAQARSCNTRSASGPKRCPVWSTAQNDPGTMRKTMENMKTLEITLLRVIPTLTHYSGMVSDIPSGSIIYIYICIYTHTLWHSIWHSFWPSIWHLFWHSF